MNRKKGFTLIELLAVIIILAIIALIATPIIMRVIENSKKAAAERGAENYVHAVEIQAAALRTDGTILDGTYGINSNGNLCPNNVSTCNASEEIKIDMNGKKPSSGSVVISNGKVVASGANDATTSLTIGDYTATIGSNGNATATKVEASISHALTMNDVISHVGVDSLSISDEGNISGKGAFGVVVLDATDISFNLDQLIAAAGFPLIVYKDGNDFYGYGQDFVNQYKFTNVTQKYQVSTASVLTKSGSVSQNDIVQVKLIGNTVECTDSYGSKLTITPANCIGFWVDNTLNIEKIQNITINR